MDFFTIKETTNRNGVIEIYPDFLVGRSEDLMIRAKSFYAIWDEDRRLWSTDEYDVQRIVDQKLKEYREEVVKRTGGMVHVRYLRDFSTNSWSNFRKYMNNVSDNAKPLDENLTFSNSDISKKDYVSRRLNYPLQEGSIEAYDQLIGTLYLPEERQKIEWAIGAIVAGEAKNIQKFMVLYGEAGAGKSTILNIIQKLFEGYYVAFEAKALTSNNNAFSTEVFKDNPLVAIQHDGDLSRIEDNSKLNSIVSHEEITMNEKFKPSYMARVNAFLFMATNRPVKITDAKSGIIRRLIDVSPSGKLVPIKTYQAIMSKIDFELGAIAHHCLSVYRDIGPNYYDKYRPLSMILQTDIFYNFVESVYHVFKETNGATLKQSYEMYKVYCDEALIEYKMPRHKFREEMKEYFEEFHDVTRVNGKQVRSYYEGFKAEKFVQALPDIEEPANSLVMNRDISLLDELYRDAPAQYANESGTPIKRWDEVKTTLKDIDKTKLHYVRLPVNHIVIDFDIKDEDGVKSLEKNIEAASQWPATYAEFSRSGAGIHLHYYYEGDASRLSRVYDDEIEVKVFTGKSSLRRQFTKANDVPISTINSGLPIKETKMINETTVKSEMGLRNLIKRNLNKEIHPATKPSIDFIVTILDDAFTSGLVYDVSDMIPEIITFANNSTNQAGYCLGKVKDMKFISEKESEPLDNYSSDELIFFDVEVYPNLFMCSWKVLGEDKETVVMINPSSSEIEELLKMKLIGFNNRRYDNHIMYGRYIGYDNAQLYKLSQRIINGDRTAMFREAYNLSYMDLYEMSVKKQSLKMFQIELGINHQEMDIPWDEPVDESLWPKIAEYNINDVLATEAVFNARQGDYKARLILSKLSGLPPNSTTQNHAARIIFGKDRNPQDRFIYTDLSEMFPGYEFDFGKSTYRGEEVGEGGYVYAEPGIHTNVALLDIESMHPTSGVQLDIFGPYTRNFEELRDARLAIKHNDIKKASQMLGGILTPFLEGDLQSLSNALKIVINIVYGMTSAKFPNPFKDPKNIDNIVAKRGALFMVDLKHAVWEKGYSVAHIKTDSIKIPNADKEIIDFVTEFGKQYGYVFEHEATYDKLALVNDAVYVAKDISGEWTATGAQFKHPYVFKTLFTEEPIEFEDLCETKQVTTSLYLDMNETLPEDDHNYVFVGKVGSFCPIKDGKGGGVLLREKEGVYHAASGSKGYRWLEAKVVKELKKEEDIELGYFNKLADAAIDTIEKFGDFEQFRN